MTDSRSSPRCTAHIGQTDDGRWVSASNESPYFCFFGETEEAVRAKTARAWKFYTESDDDVSITELAEVKVHPVRSLEITAA